MTKKEKNLIIVTVVMVLLLAVCALYDRSSALISRTLPYELPADTKLVDIDKHGFMFYRVAYEAKIEIDPSNPEEILTCFVDGFGDSGDMISHAEFDSMSQYMYDNYYSYVRIKPEPVTGSTIWLHEAELPGGHSVIHFIDLEEGEHAYLYIYYVR
ncbi:MAG: hypothetical protein IJ757_02540 [Clostridiales bacterium]|nr:hypothetical protein [Clostridiales bacterium]